jgi:putative oxidoreductase
MRFTPLGCTRRSRNEDKTMDSSLQTWSPRVLSVLRIMTALLFMQHGTAKLLGFPKFPGFENVQIASLLGVSGILELVGGALMLIGLFTRPTAFVLSGFMAVAYFMAHAPQGFFPMLNQGELAILYCFVFLYFAVAGGGAWSVDAARGAR